MPLQPMIPLLRKAQAEGYAVGLFDTISYEMTTAIVDAAVELHAPVIIGPFYLHRRGIAALIRELAADAPIPIAVELDHGRSFRDVMEAIRAGYTDVMLDASAEPYERNVALTRQAVEAAHAAGVGVEGEIGHVGQASEADEALEAAKTQPEEVARFVADTGVDALAVAIGSAHGVYRGEPRLDFDLLRRIHTAVDVPLVLHGGSGISDDDFRRAAREGMSKINIYTAMALAAVSGARQTLAAPQADYPQLCRGIYGAIKEVVAHHIQVFGSAGKA